MAFIVTFLLIGCKQAILATTSAEATAATTAATTVETTVATTAATSTETTVATTTGSSTENETTPTQEQQQVIYRNTQYGFSFSLPISWEGYKIIPSKWEGSPTDPQGD